MSMSNLGTASYTITGNAAGATNAAAQANNALASLSNTVNNNWWGIQNLGRAFAALPAAIGVGVGFAIKASIDWQDAMFNLQRATGDSDEAVQAIGASIMEVAKTTPLATAELAGLAATGAQLGVANESLSQFAEIMGLLISSTNLTEANVGDFARVINVLQVPEADFEKFANTLLEVGRNTAATESEILNITKRMSGAAAVAGITADQLLGIGAAVISLGPRAEAGGTAFNKTIADMTRAVASGGDKLEIFASIANMTSDAFRNLFREDAAKAFANFVTGLARLKGGGEQAITALDELGITETRQSQALLQLAQGTLDVGSKQRDLNAILGFTADRWQNSNALQEVAAQKAKTLSGQIQLLKNSLFQVGTVIGKFIIPWLGFGVQRLLDFLAGVQALPTPVKLLVGGLFALVTALSAVAAIALIVGPRLIIGYDAFLRLTTGAGLAGGAVGGFGGASYGAVGGVGALTIAVENLTLAMMGSNRAVVNGISNLFTYTSAAALASKQQAASNANTGLSLLSLGGKASKFGKIAGVLGLALTGLTLVTTFLGNKQRAAAVDAEKMLDANDKLTGVMRTQGAAVGPASTKWLEASGKFKAASRAAKELGFSLVALTRIIQGIGTAKDIDSLVATVKKGGSEAKKFGKQVVDLATVWQKSSAAAGVAKKATADFGAAEDGAGAATAETNKKLKEQIELLTTMAQAIVDLVDAQENQKSAAIALADAQDSYAEALSNQEHSADAIAAAERDLEQARSDASQAAQDLADKEAALGEAREIGARRAQDAEFDLADARDRVADGLQNIADLEQKVTELRNVDPLRELIKLTNELHDAEIGLARAHQTVDDAEFHLQQIREEGGSARDISDAQLALTEAKNNESKANEDLIDSQDKLNSLQENQGRDLLDAEEALAKARRDSIRDIRDVTDKEKELAKARKAIADDSDYLAAQRDVMDAQDGVEQALEDVRQAELDLQAIRNGKLEREVAKAELELEGAIIQVARANVEVQKQQALSNGLTWDAGDAAHALGAELGKLSGLAPTQDMIDRINAFAGALGKAPNIPNAPKDSSGGGGGFDPGDFGLPEPTDVANYVDGLTKALDDAGKDVKKKGAFSISNALGGAVSGAFTGAAIASIIPIPGLSQLVGGIIGGIVGLLVGGFGADRVGAAIGDLVSKGVNFVTSGSIPARLGKSLALGLLNPMLGTAALLVNVAKTGLGKSLIGGIKNVFGAGESEMDKFKNIANKTQQSIETAFEHAQRTLISSFAKTGQVSQGATNAIVSDVNKMHDLVVDKTNQIATKRIAEFTRMNAETKALSADEAANVIARIEEMRTSSITSAEQRRAAVLAQVQELRDKGVIVTDDMVRTMIASLETLRDKSIEATERSKLRQEALLESLRLGTEEITKKEYDQVVKTANKKRDDVVAAAKKQAEDTIAEAIRQRNDGVLTQAEYEKTVRKANEMRDGTISAARTTADETVAAAQRLRDGTRGPVDEAFNHIPAKAREAHAEAKKGGSFDLGDIGNFVIESLKTGMNLALPGLGTFLGGVGNFIKAHKGPASADKKMLTPAGKWIMQGLISGMEDEERNLLSKLQDIAGMIEGTIAQDYLAGFSADSARAGFNSNVAGAVASRNGAGTSSTAGGVTYHDEFNLEAITSSDPAEIVNEYTWARRVRRRGGVAR